MTCHMMHHCVCTLLTSTRTVTCLNLHGVSAAAPRSETKAPLYRLSTMNRYSIQDITLATNRNSSTCPKQPFFVDIVTVKHLRLRIGLEDYTFSQVAKIVYRS
ncbi:hypothetical protein C8Q75DRAFT_488235 [Abortiporus biennis]|nr:hypothetical protein C8Q75DRAFT_488235 [Abortiporus biennis]